VTHVTVEITASAASAVLVTLVLATHAIVASVHQKLILRRNASAARTI